jgi:mono/diheme cytochrome c family protein
VEETSPEVLRSLGLANKQNAATAANRYRGEKEEKNMRRTIGLLIAICAAATVSLAADAKAGQAIFDKSCKSCHGADGAGNPNIAKMMKVEMRPLGSAAVQAQSDDELKQIITNGKGKMPKVASVTGKSVDDVVAYVRTLKK